jgi:N-acetylmuramoyl-L-alanine amidase CwlA
MAEFRDALLTVGRGRPGEPLTDPRGLVIHWTADARRGADAIAVRAFMDKRNDPGSAMHYLVDDRRILRCVPETEVARHMDPGNYRQGAVAFLGPKPELHTLSIGWCVNENSDGAETYRNVVAVAGSIVSRHGWDLWNLFRHHDISGRVCPPFFVDDRWARKLGFGGAAAPAWDQFRRDVLIAARAAQVTRALRS